MPKRLDGGRGPSHLQAAGSPPLRRGCGSPRWGLGFADLYAD